MYIIADVLISTIEVILISEIEFSVCRIPNYALCTSELTEMYVTVKA